MFSSCNSAPTKDQNQETKQESKKVTFLDQNDHEVKLNSKEQEL